MTLHHRLLLAQTPLLAALLAVALLGVVTLRRLGARTEVILEDNYRSVLAAQRMKEALERINSGALILVAGDPERGLAQAAIHRQRFEQQLLLQEDNITEEGESEATARLRAGWGEYQRAFEAFVARGDPPAAYFQELSPRFEQTSRQADEVLQLNHDAMVRKSDQARRTAERVNQVMIAGALLAFALGVFASGHLTRRTLRPLGVLSQAVRRVGEGDLEVRARLPGKDELASLAADFNAMAASLAQYRQSSLGELLQAQQASQAAIDSLPDPVIVVGRGGEVLNVNAAAAVLGIPAELGVGDPLSHAPPDVRALVEKVRTHVLSGQGAYVPRGFEEALRLQQPEGPRAFLARGAPVQGADGVLAGATVILQDVTRLQRFDELKNDLVATVAHEFRTPLTSLAMAIHLCLAERAGPITEGQADLLTAARDDCDRLQRIVDDLLDLSRLQSGKVRIDRRPVAAQALVDATLHAHAPDAEARRVHLVAEPIDESELSVDPERLSLVFTNLIRNALRHVAPGGTVIVRGRREEAGYRFEVRDDGPGIPAEYQQRIFEKFFRVPGAAPAGAGLGLSIAREIVLEHEGDIGVISAPGEGSTFWFTVPLAAPAAA